MVSDVPWEGQVFVTTMPYRDRFRYGIVVTNTCPSQGTSDTILLAVPIEISGGVLRSAVGMEDHSRRRPAVGDSHIQSGRDELGAHMVGNGPPDQLAGIQVDHGRHVRPAVPRLHVRDITAPLLVGSLGTEGPPDQVGRRHRLIPTDGRAFPRLRMASAQASDLHEAPDT